MAKVPGGQNMEIRTFADVFAYLESFTNLEKSPVLFNQRSYRLNRMQALLSAFDDPHLSCRVIHVAGTKGKGSTAVLAASVLAASGERTGLYTSPHVESYWERIAVLGRDPDEGLLVALTRDLQRRLPALAREPAFMDGPPNTFELLTLLGFAYFREQRCDSAVIETGLGGRLDATNVVSPDFCLITPVELEHTEILGETIEEIAAEKGGIIKPGVPVFCAAQDPRAEAVLRRLAAERGSPITFLPRECLRLRSRTTLSGTNLRFRLREGTGRRFRLGLLGDFQAENAALVYLALKTCREIKPAAFKAGFRTARLPGRMEILSRSPLILLDGAHTPQSVRRLLHSFRTLFPRRGLLVFGAVAGKKAREMAALLAPAFRRVIITTPGTFKPSNPEEVYTYFKELNPDTVLIPDTAAAYRQAKAEAGTREPLLVTGSFYLAGEVRKLERAARAARATRATRANRQPGTGGVS
jgi:dihydrofolate synthase/folylpolyglutamate synthase